MKKNFENNKRNGGYAILELLFYIALFSVLSFVIINAMIAMSKSFKETVVQVELMQSVNILERISREIRGAHGINTISVNNLVLNTKDEADVDKTVQFLVAGSNLQLLENGVLIGNLNTPNLQVAALSFAEIITAQGKAIKVFLTVRSVNDTTGRSEDFYNTVVLRGDY
jgi:Tfp pilus assembly protein PilE